MLNLVPNYELFGSRQVLIVYNNKLIERLRVTIDKEIVAENPKRLVELWLYKRSLPVAVPEAGIIRMPGALLDKRVIFFPEMHRFFSRDKSACYNAAVECYCKLINKYGFRYNCNGFE